MRVCDDSHVAGVVAVKATPFLSTHVTTAVRNLTTLPLWVCHFACQSNVNIEETGGYALCILHD